MENLKKNSRGNTDLKLITPMEQLGLWRSGALRQGEALKRANYAAELASVLWSHMTPEQHAQLEADEQISFLVRRITSAAYGM